MKKWICPKCKYVNGNKVICFNEECDYEKSFMRWAWDEKVPLLAMLYATVMMAISAIDLFK